MERPMTEWNNDRLDELNGRVENGFAKVDREMKEGFAKIDKRFEQVATREDLREVKDGLNYLGSRLDRMTYALMATGLGLIGTVFVGGLN